MIKAKAPCRRKLQGAFLYSLNSENSDKNKALFV